jgi:hypothetical protein
MTLKEIFLPWLVVRERNAKLAAKDNAYLRLLRRYEDETARLRTELAALKSRQQPRDPKTGRMLPKVRAA